MISVISFVICSLNPYWYNPKIHNLGNAGFRGNIHALASPIITKFIDEKAYRGLDVRQQIFEEIDGSVLDICCGTGFSTKPGNTGIDTSFPMIRGANLFNPGSAYIFGNAETFGKDNQYETVTCMFAFHEIPAYAHGKIIRNCIRVAKKQIIIVDISTDYKPSSMMLTGEPYIINYLKSIDNLFESFSFKKKKLIESHVDLWSYKKY